MDVVGIDIGGTQIKMGVIDEAGNIKKEQRYDTPKEAADIVESMIPAVQQLRQSYDIRAIGVGTSGIVDPVTSEIIGAGGTLKDWLGVNIKESLAALSLPVFVDNDVNTAALGESWLGVAHDQKDFVYLAIGTGLGGALVNENKIITGSLGGAGEIGHMILYPDGMPCGCGKKGCAEKYVSGTALNTYAKKISQTWSSYELIHYYQQNHKEAIQSMYTFLHDLAVVFTNIQYFYDPTVIVLGGGVADSFPIWESDFRKILSEVSNNKKIQPILSNLKNNAGMLGAAKLAFTRMDHHRTT